MMTSEQIATMLSEEFRQTVAENRGRDPLEVALDKRLPHAALVATQLKYLKRAETKLPRWAEAGCILPQRAFEQASSEAVAACKELSGERVLDLTCGLGVDSTALATRFREVVSLERDPLLAEITRENLRRLGVGNVRVVTASAEEFVASTPERFDWIYADPDRRSAEGKKLVQLEDCSPNLPALLPRLKELAPRLCIKNSPLFDVEEALRLFPTSRVEVISLGGECKEVVIYDDGTGPSLAAVAVGVGRVELPVAKIDRTPSVGPFEPERYRYLLLPDVALQKARLVCHHLRPHGFVASENGYALLESCIEGLLGELYPIERIEPYAPKELKRRLKGVGAEVMKHDFPYSVEEIRRQTGLKPGSRLRLAFTRIEGRLWCIWLNEIN